VARFGDLFFSFKAGHGVIRSGRVRRGAEEFKGFAISCVAERAGRNRFTPKVTVRFPTLLGRGLYVGTRGAGGGNFSVEDMVWVGHGEFDSVFEEVVGMSGSGVRAIRRLADPA